MVKEVVKAQIRTPLRRPDLPVQFLTSGEDGKVVFQKTGIEKKVVRIRSEFGKLRGHGEEQSQERADDLHDNQHGPHLAPTVPPSSSNNARSLLITVESP